MAQVAIISHWCKLLENFQTSPLGFYDLVEKAIKRREVPQAGSSRIEYHEGGLFGAKREYLHIKRKNLAFDICGAPFGTGFFVSYWFGKVSTGAGILTFISILAISGALFSLLTRTYGFYLGALFCVALIPVLLLLFGYLISDGKIGGEDTILATPIIGYLYNKIFHPLSYYKLDTIQMYQAAIHAALMEVVDELLATNGLRTLTETERKPIMKDFLGK